MNIINTEVIIQNFMRKYNELADSDKRSGIEITIDELNNAISSDDMTGANTAYSKILNWNFKVGNLEGEREAINKHLYGAKLPSVNVFAIVYDNQQKLWRFNS